MIQSAPKCCKLNISSFEKIWQMTRGWFVRPIYEWMSERSRPESVEASFRTDHRVQRSSYNHSIISKLLTYQILVRSTKDMLRHKFNKCPHQVVYHINPSQVYFTKVDWLLDWLINIISLRYILALLLVSPIESAWNNRGAIVEQENRKY